MWERINQKTGSHGVQEYHNFFVRCVEELTFLKTKTTKNVLKGTRYTNRLVYLNASIINIETSENRDIM